MFRQPSGAGPRRSDAELAAVDAAITAFGIALDEHPFAPGQPGATDDMRADLGHALDAYDEAKRAFDADPDSGDALRAVDAGRHALACLDARLAGRPLPSRRPPCFFDARHGPSTTDTTWAPAHGTPRGIAVCTACAVRLGDEAARGPAAPPPPEVRAPARAHAPAPVRPTPRPLPLARRSAPKPGSGPPGEPRTGRGNVRGFVHYPVPDRPAALRVRTETAAVLTVVVRTPGAPERRYRVGGTSDSADAFLPLPRAGEAAGARFELIFAKTDAVAWTVESSPLDTLPTLPLRHEGHACELFRHTGQPGAAGLRNAGGGDFSLLALDADLRDGTQLVRGRGPETVAFTWPGPGCYLVRARGPWSLRTEAPG
ncbi:hypothetical protein ACL02R_10205 [Streptomyces sp. MS19]|uniref:hypothetical protein n=1 Tax=Streptomyces sp. MS19 TaxID=3385972 RepID=UPI0039A0FA61